MKQDFPYETLEQFYYKNQAIHGSYVSEYRRRINSPDTHKIDISIHADDVIGPIYPAFFCLDDELREAIQSLEDRDASLQYKKGLLKKSGVKKQLAIREMLKNFEIEQEFVPQEFVKSFLQKKTNQNKNLALWGLLSEYLTFFNNPSIPKNAYEIRALYDRAIWPNIRSEETPENLEHLKLDGILFRLGTVEIGHAFVGDEIYEDMNGKIRNKNSNHKGTSPESAIINELNTITKLYSDAPFPSIVNIALHYFVFNNTHPFYDGNGRCSRLIASSQIAQNYDIVTALSFSQAYLEDKKRFEKAFSICQKSKNSGDLTPFLWRFIKTMGKALDIAERSISVLSTAELNPEKISTDLSFAMLNALTISDMPELDKTREQLIEKLVKPSMNNLTN